MEKDLLEKNESIGKELNRLRKNEFQLKMQIKDLRVNQEKDFNNLVQRNKTIVKRTSLAKNHVNQFLINLDVKKTNIRNGLREKDRIENEPRKISKLTGLSTQQRKWSY